MEGWPEKHYLPWMGMLNNVIAESARDGREGHHVKY
jgi:hypothetical protein